MRRMLRRYRRRRPILLDAVLAIGFAMCGRNCWPLDNWVSPSAKIGSRPNKSPKRKKSENHHHHRRAGVRRWRRIRRPPARSIHRRQLPVRLLLDGILLRAIGRTGRGRETSGRQLPEWLARVGQRVRPQRALTVPLNGWNRLFVVVGVVWALVAPFLFSSAVKLRISSTALAVANHKVR